MGKLVLGIVLGTFGYAAWKLSEPALGESDDMLARIERLRREWNGALAQGKAAGAQTQTRLEADFAEIFRH